MYPNQPDQSNQPAPPQDYSIDYLNQISTPQKKSGGPSPKQLGIIIAVLLALLIAVGALMFLSNRSTPMGKATEMYARMQTLEKLAKSQHKHLRDGELRSTNSSYSLFLANAIRDLKTPLETADVNLNSLPDKIKTNETELNDELAAKFDEERLNVRLDRAYAREMNYQLNVLHSMMTSIYNSTNNSALKEYLETTEENLAQISTSFGKFSDTK